MESTLQLLTNAIASLTEHGEHAVAHAGAFVMVATAKARTEAETALAAIASLERKLHRRKKSAEKNAQRGGKR